VSYKQVYINLGYSIGDQVHLMMDKHFFQSGILNTKYSSFILGMYLM